MTCSAGRRPPRLAQIASLAASAQAGRAGNASNADRTRIRGGMSLPKRKLAQERPPARSCQIFRQIDFPARARYRKDVQLDRLLEEITCPVAFVRRPGLCPGSRYGRNE